MRRVHVIGTGGTIVSRGTGSPSGAVASDGLAGLLAGIDDVGTSSSQPFTVGSFLLGHGHLRQLADEVRSAAPSVDGIVVTHGTDTMEESAFLIDLVHDSPVPVVFTGAQLAADHPDTDGPRNLGQAVAAAADPALSGSGVTLCFGGRLRAARGTSKVHTLAPDPFHGGTLLAEYVVDRWVRLARPIRHTPLTLSPRFDDVRVDVIALHVDVRPDIIAAHLGLGADGLILAAMGTGNATPDIVREVARATENGHPVVVTSRTGAGSVAPIYGNGGGVDLARAGAVFAGHLNTNQARLLTAVLLSAGPEDFATRFRNALNH